MGLALGIGLPVLSLLQAPLPALAPESLALELPLHQVLVLGGGPTVLSSRLVLHFFLLECLFYV